MVNLLFFETACCELELLLSSLKESRLGPSPTGSNSVTELDSVTSFRDTLEATSERMVQLISAKTDSFFELAEYEWTPAYVPSGQIEERPSSYLTEMVDYLKLVMDSMLLQLPDVLKNTVYRRALQHVADTMMSYLIDPDPSKMNDTGLSIFAVDVRFIVQHAASVFPDLSAESGDVFEELSQMVALLQDDDLTQFLDPDIRDLGFPRIQNTRMQYALVKVSLICLHFAMLRLTSGYTLQLITYYNSVDQRSIDAQRRNDAEELLKTIAQT